MTMRWLRPKRLDPGLQVYIMRRFFPGFKCQGSCGRYVFRGYLQPCENSEVYQIAIHYQRGTVPRVFVTSPQLNEEAPHLFSDGALCLFHPLLFRWHEGHLIASRIVPLTAAWLLFYETWKKLGVWLGPEAPHAPDQPKE